MWRFMFFFSQKGTQPCAAKQPWITSVTPAGQQRIHVYFAFKIWYLERKFFIHFTVLFLLHLSLQHLAEIRFLRKRNLEMALWCRSVHPGCTRHRLPHASRLKWLEFLCSWFKPLFFHHLSLSFPAFLFSCYSAQVMIVIQLVEGLEMWKDSMGILFFSSKY